MYLVSTTDISRRMKRTLRSSRRSLAAAVVSIFILTAAIPGAAAAPNDSVIVRSMLGGQISGFALDQAGNEGILAEAQTLPGGKVLAAVETFDQTTGAIIKVIQQTQSQDDFLVLGVVGDSVGLIEREHSKGLFDVTRTFSVIDPLRRNRFTGRWTPPLDGSHIINSVSRNQGTDNVAVFAEDSAGQFRPIVFSSNVAANTFGPVATITDQDFNSGLPAFGYNSATNQAVLGAPKLGNPFLPGRIATIDLATGVFTKFTSVGLGNVNGLAVDPVTGTACTVTEIDFSVEFYNLATHAGTVQPLPNANNQIFRGTDVQFDAVNRLFLVAQEFSSTSPTGSSVHVYDAAGNFIKSINGLDFLDVPIVLNPSKRLGYVLGGIGLTEIHSFSY